MVGWNHIHFMSELGLYLQLQVKRHFKKKKKIQKPKPHICLSQMARVPIVVSAEGPAILTRSSTVQVSGARQCYYSSFTNRELRHNGKILFSIARAKQFS